MKIFANRAVLCSAMILGSFTFMSLPAQAQAPFDKFTSAAPASSQSIDYSALDDFYEAASVKNRDRRNFRYSALKINGQKIMDAYLRFFAGQTPTRMSKDEQLAYWLNLRNLLVVHAIASGNASRSLKAARGDLETPGQMWTRKRMEVEDVTLSIDDIERKIILANWDDPNLVYGLYQGVKGGPAFTVPASFHGPTIKEELKMRAEANVNARRALRVRNTEVKVPAVYDWYKASLFNGDDQQILDHLKAHSQGKLAEKLAVVETIDYAKMNYKVDREQARQQDIQPPTGAPGGPSFRGYSGS